MAEGRHAYLCPLCGDVIEAIEPEELPPLTDVPVEVKIAQVTKANEVVLRFHLHSEHDLDDAMRALGVARNALMDIREIVNMVREQGGWAYLENVDQALVQSVAYGLGGK